MPKDTLCQDNHDKEAAPEGTLADGQIKTENGSVDGEIKSENGSPGGQISTKNVSMDGQNGTVTDDKNTLDPEKYGYLANSEFTSEIFKIEINNLPKRIGFGVSDTLTHNHLNFPPGNIDLCHHCFTKWLGLRSTPSHFLNQC